MKKITAIFVMILFIMNSFIVYGNQNIKNNNDSYFLTVNNENPTSIQITLGITKSSLYLNDIIIDNFEFTDVEIPREGFTNVLGEAKLPVIRKMIEIPKDSTITIKDLYFDWEYIYIDQLGFQNQIIPVQPSKEKVPDIESNLVFNEEYYSKDLFMPDYTIKIESTGIIRGKNFVLLEIFPIQYNPYKNQIKILNDYRFNIDLTENTDKTFDMIKRLSSKPFDDLYNHLFINYDINEKLLSKDPEGYLVISHDSFYEEILPFINWKENNGYEVTLINTSEIPGGPTKENIKSYIEEAYNNWAIPPTYILLVGDVDQIPTYYNNQAVNTDADLYYVTVDGSDYFPDIFIGRFPASQESHVTSMVDKTIFYEQGNYPENYLNMTVFMASTDNYQVSEGTHNYVIDNYLEPNGYSYDKLYTVTYDATTNDVSNSINDGRHLAIFSGHGSTTSWADGPPFSQSNVNSLTNEDLYSFVCSHACVTGDFSVSECFGETWLRAPNKAAFAFWGSSYNTLWPEDDVLEKKMFSAWWDDGIESIGGMTDMALYYLYEYYGGGGNTQRYFESYNLFGDPSVKIKPPVLPDHNVGVQSLSVPSYVTPDELVGVDVGVYNNGQNDESDVVVSFRVNDSELDSVVIPFF